MTEVSIPSFIMPHVHITEIKMFQDYDNELNPPQPSLAVRSYRRLRIGSRESFLRLSIFCPHDLCRGETMILGVKN